MKTVAFFNNKGGVGKTSLVYHLAWMFAGMGHKIVAADLDPQANLTSMFIDETEQEKLWSDNKEKTVYTVLDPLISGTGDIRAPTAEQFGKISLLVGDLNLSLFEDYLSAAWRDLNSSKPERAFRETTAFYRTMSAAAKSADAQYVFIDVGPNLGAINRAALISADYVIVPLGADLFSLQGLRNMGPTLNNWRQEWSAHIASNKAPDVEKPQGKITPLGYILMRHGVKSNKPAKSYGRWINRMPMEYRQSMLNEPNPVAIDPNTDSYCLAMLKDYRSLMPMAQEARKPMFLLKSTDGAIGAHQGAVEECYADFKALAERMLTLLRD